MTNKQLDEINELKQAIDVLEQKISTLEGIISDTDGQGIWVLGSRYNGRKLDFTGLPLPMPQILSSGIYNFVKEQLESELNATKREFEVIVVGRPETINVVKEL
jgi:hypothetical protein